MRNPDKYIRKAIVESWEAQNPDIPIFDTQVPISEGTPRKFILVQSISKSRFAESKGHYEWLGTVQIMSVSVNEKGFVVSSIADDLEEMVIPVVENIQIPEFRVSYSKFVSSQPSNIEAPAETITRKVTTFEMWLNKAD